MTWTSTLILMWQTDCEDFLETKQPFELRDIQTPEHEAFVVTFAKEHNLKIKRLRRHNSSIRSAFQLDLLPVNFHRTAGRLGLIQSEEEEQTHTSCLK